jgi:pimeloyl-ACP methyl ester carboxylesterase
VLFSGVVKDSTSSLPTTTTAPLASTPCGIEAQPRNGAPRRSSLGLALSAASLVVCASGCAPKSLFGQLVHVEEHPLEVKGKTLSYYEGSSWQGEADADAEKRPPAWSKDPVVVFVSDLGEGCELFDDGEMRRFVTTFTGRYVFVRPKSLFEVACETEELYRLDLAWRHAELDALFASLGKEHPGQPVVLVGEAFGSTIALDWLAKNTSQAAGFVALGGPLGDVERVFVQVARESGLEQREITREVDQLRSIFERLAKEPDRRDPLWGRSPAFWAQLTAVDPKARLGALGVPALVVQGDSDTTRVPSSMLASARRELKRAGAAHVRYAELAGVGDDLRRPEAFRAIDDFAAEVAKTATKAPSAAAPAAPKPAVPEPAAAP